MRLGQAEVWLNVFASDDDLSDVISRHPAGSWPWPEDTLEDTPEERPPGWQGTEERPPGWDPFPELVERPPPGEPSPYWYQVGPGELFYWQWAAIGVGVVLFVAMSDRGGRRRR